MPDVDVLTHAIETTAKAHGLRTIEQAFAEYREQLVTALSVRQRMQFGLSQIRATVERYEARVVDEDQDIRKAFVGSPDLVAMMLTCLGEIDAVAKAALEGCE